MDLVYWEDDDAPSIAHCTEGTVLVIPTKRNKGKIQAAERVLKKLSKDIGFIDYTSEEYVILRIRSRPGKGCVGFEAVFGKDLAEKLYMASVCGRFELPEDTTTE